MKFHLVIRALAVVGLLALSACYTNCTNPDGTPKSCCGYPCFVKH